MSHPTAGPLGEITRLLDDARGHGGAAMGRLFELVYDELRRVAAARVRQFGGTLSATGLVHEVYLKFASGGPPKALSRAHFLAIAARAMRQLLIDHHREGAAIKRGGGWAQTTLGEDHGAVAFDADHVLALDDALERLEARQRQVAEYRLFAGMEEREIAEILGISDRTVRRDWTKARAWLVHALVLRPDG